MVVFDLLVNCVSELHSPVQSQPGGGVAFVAQLKLWMLIIYVKQSVNLCKE